jgi:radical SAM protein with 4Fe4S-binding SPASM domain
MALKQFLQNLFERVGLAESPMPPPAAADFALDELQHIEPILLRLSAWGVKQVRFAVSDPPEPDDLLQAAGRTKDLGMDVGIRGRASDLSTGGSLSRLAAAGVREVELPIISAVAEVHDALAGMGDYRCMLKSLDTLSVVELTAAVQLVLTPSSWKTIGRTMELLEDRGVRSIHVWAVACRDDEPSSWAFSPGELIDAAAWLESHAPREMKFTWYPPLKFNPSRTLAEQVRRGPRAARDAVRIEANGDIIPPIGSATSGGNIAQNDWKTIARSEVFRSYKRRCDAAPRCEQCPALAACESGFRCIRDDGNWAKEAG